MGIASSHEASGIVHVVIDRPEKRNALRLDDWAAIDRVLDKAAAMGARAVIVSGAGKTFCAGSDLTEIAGLCENEPPRAEFRDTMAAVMQRLETAPYPTIAAISGDCFGAGVAIAMACDIRIGDATARFGITPAKFGITYPQGDIARLRALVGRGQAARLLFGAETIAADEAQRVGLIDLLEPDALTAAAGLAERIAANSAGSVAALKRGLNASSPADGDPLFTESFASTDFRRFSSALTRRRQDS